MGIDKNETLASYAAVRALLDARGLAPKKNFGQNFLTDAFVLGKIVNAAGVDSSMTAIEIGPGLGALTAELAKRAGKVLAVEIDGGLIPVLEETLSAYGNVRLVHGDVLKLDLAALLAEENAARACLVANLPYYITTPIVFRVLESRLPLESMTVMVQKEVGERMRALPSSKAYGAVTVMIRYYADVELVANVPPNCFFPRPNVDSAVVKLMLLREPRVAVADEAFFFALIHAAFAMRRKTLVNCLSADEALGIGKAEAAAALAACGLSESVRGEALDIHDFARLAAALKK